MTKCKRALAAMMVVVSVLINCMTASAATGIKCDSCNADMSLYSRVFKYQEKTGEHTVYVNGKYAVCFIYKEYYECSYYCTACNKYKFITEVVSNVHSLNH